MKIRVKCCSCGKKIVVDVPRHIVKSQPRVKDALTCNECVPENSPARDGINESIYTEIDHTSVIGTKKGEPLWRRLRVIGLTT